MILVASNPRSSCTSAKPLVSVAIVSLDLPPLLRCIAISLFRSVTFWSLSFSAAVDSANAAFLESRSAFRRLRSLLLCRIFCLSSSKDDRCASTCAWATAKSRSRCPSRSPNAPYSAVWVDGIGAGVSTCGGAGTETLTIGGAFVTFTVTGGAVTATETGEFVVGVDVAP